MSRLLILFCLSFLLSCAVQPDLAMQYRLAIEDASIIEPEEVVSLPVIHQGTVKVVSWTKYPESYVVGNHISLEWGEIWVTLDGVVKKLCQQYDKSEQRLKVQQLLGLPAKNEERFFVTLSVESTYLFRPCANPSIKVNSCSDKFLDNLSENHQLWYAKQVSASYRSPEGFPWTRLGYTYHWGLGKNEIGPAEFVIQKGARIEVLSVESTETYCSSIVHRP